MNDHLRQELLSMVEEMVGREEMEYIISEREEIIQEYMVFLGAILETIGFSLQAGLQNITQALVTAFVSGVMAERMRQRDRAFRGEWPYELS